jgi:hypothetical protein
MMKPSMRLIAIFDMLSVLLVSIVSAVPAPLPTTTYTTKYLDPFINGSWDFGIQTPIIISIFGDTFGANGASIVTGTWLVTIVALYWLRHDDVVIPFFMMVLLTNIAFWTPGLIPQEWLWFLVIACVLLPFVAIVYVLITER